jgi:biotin-[acetyl-CoA-carboxylase] ligase BirA-like protein
MNSKTNKFSIFQETKDWLKEKNVSFSADEHTTSTNDVAKIEALILSDELKVYLADQQAAGRGRHTNTWSNTNSGDALLCTWSFACYQHPQAITGPLFGLAVFTALQKTLRLSGLSIKPPNDLYLSDKKISGILAETIQSGQATRLIVGVGLNVFSSPTSVEIASHLSSKINITRQLWRIFLDELLFQMQEAAHSSQAAHLTETQRDHLLTAVNACPIKRAPYMSVSPFGDLVLKDQTISWRDL